MCAAVRRSIQRASAGSEVILKGLASTVAFCYHSAMSQPVKLSDDLVLDARLAGELLERSIAGQIEFWAQLGRAMEPLLMGATVMAAGVFVVIYS